MFKKKLLHVVLLVLIFKMIDGELINFDWEKSNEMFASSNANATLWVHMGDKLTITCPKTTTRGYAYLKIFLVSEEEYRFCFLRPGREITVCNNSSKNLFFGFVFREFTPIPNGLTFQPNKMYYFISTSSGRLGGMNQKKGGLCSTRNMKLRVFVKPARPYKAKSLQGNDGLGNNTPKKDYDGNDQWNFECRKNPTHYSKSDPALFFFKTAIYKQGQKLKPSYSYRPC